MGLGIWNKSFTNTISSVVTAFKASRIIFFPLCHLPDNHVMNRMLFHHKNQKSFGILFVSMQKDIAHPLYKLYYFLYCCLKFYAAYSIWLFIHRLIQKLNAKIINLVFCVYVIYYDLKMIKHVCVYSVLPIKLPIPLPKLN